MPAPPKHRGAIVDAAVLTFRRKGYSASGVADIVDLAGAPKGSLYHFFPGGKAAIGEAAVREAGRRVCETLDRLAKDAGSTPDLITSHARLLGAWMAKSRFRDGCPMTTVLLEMAPENTAVTVAGREAYAARNRVLCARLIEDGFSPARADRLAVLCTSALQGALVQSRVDKSQAPLLAVAEELAVLLRLAAR